MAEREYTRWEKFSNWFYYNKWFLAVGLLVVYVAGSMVWNALSIGQTKPDHCIAYVGSRKLPEDAVTALQEALAAYGEDVNGDGIVAVQLSQHITAEADDLENAMYSYGAEITVLADITQGESYFFLLEDPDKFQRDFQVLAALDGSIPADGDISGIDKVYRWSDRPVLTGLELGNYTDSYLDQTQTGECQDLMQDLFLGRRYFYEPEIVANQRHNERMWDRLTEVAAKNP